MAWSCVPRVTPPNWLLDMMLTHTQWQTRAQNLSIATGLFIDGGDVFIPASKPLGPLDGGKQRFAIVFATPAEASAVKGKSLALTLVSDQGSTETIWKVE